MDFDYIKEYLSNFDLVKANALEVMKESFKFDGNLNRTKFFTFYVFITLVIMIVVTVSSLISIIPFVGWILGILLGFVALGLFWMLLGPWTCRLRDAGYGPIQFCWFLLCIVGGIVPFVITFFKSANEEAPAAQPAAQPTEQPAAQPAAQPAEQPQNQEPPANN